MQLAALRESVQAKVLLRGGPRGTPEALLAGQKVRIRYQIVVSLLFGDWGSRLHHSKHGGITRSKCTVDHLARMHLM